MKNLFLKRISLHLRIRYENYLEKNFARKLKRDNLYKISSSDIDKINMINQSAFKSVEFIDELNIRYSSEESLIKYCNCITPAQIKIYTGDNWYICFAHHYRYIECVDFAFLNGKCEKPLETAVMIWKIFKNQGNKVFLSYVREKTSYRFLKNYEKRKKLKITSEEPFQIGTEQLYRISFILCSDYGE